MLKVPAVIRVRPRHFKICGCNSPRFSLKNIHQLLEVFVLVANIYPRYTPLICPRVACGTTPLSRDEDFNTGRSAQ